MPMPNPCYVPSQTTFFALRGLLFGTTYSVFFFVEERCQRIRLARAIVRNQRAKIEYAKRHYRATHAVRGSPDSSDADQSSRSKDAGKGGRRPSAAGTTRDVAEGDARPNARFKDEDQKPVNGVATNDMPEWARQASDALSKNRQRKAEMASQHPVDVNDTDTPFPPRISVQESPPSLWAIRVRRRTAFHQLAKDEGWSRTQKLHAFSPGESPSTRAGSNVDRESQVSNSAEFDRLRKLMLESLACGNTTEANAQLAELEGVTGTTIGLSDWFLRQLLLNGFQNEALEFFATKYKVLKLFPRKFFESCEIIVKGLYSFSHPGLSSSSDPVLNSRLICPERTFAVLLDVAHARECDLPQRAMTQVLRMHWQFYRDYSRLQKLMKESDFDTSLIADVEYLNFCIMTPAAEAGDVATLEHVTRLYEQDAFLFMKKRFYVDIGVWAMIKGKLTLAKAVAEDWDGVLDELRALKDHVMPTGSLLQTTLLEVFRELAKKCTTDQVNDFLQMCVEEIGLPVGENMVYKVADLYASAGDIEGFGQWMEMCLRQGFSETRTIMTTIINCCVKHWKYGQKSMEYLLMRLERASFGYHTTSNGAGAKNSNTFKTRAETEDYETELREWEAQTEAEAKAGEVEAATDLDEPLVRNRRYIEILEAYVIRARKVAVMPYLIKFADYKARGRFMEIKLHYWMVVKFEQRDYEAVFQGFKLVAGTGFLPSEQCLRLAVEAATKKYGAASGEAWQLILDAHSKGTSVSASMCLLLSSGLEEAAELFGASVVSRARGLLNKALRSRMPIHPLVFNRAARMCLRAQDFRSSILIANAAMSYSAMESGTSVGQSFDSLDQYTFANLVAAYAASEQFDSLVTLLENFTSAEFAWKADNLVKRVLRRTMDRLDEILITLNLDSRNNTEAFWYRHREQALRKAQETTMATLNHVTRVRRHVFKHRWLARDRLDMEIIRLLSLDLGPPRWPLPRFLSHFDTDEKMVAKMEKTIEELEELEKERNLGDRDGFGQEENPNSSRGHETKRSCW